MSRKSNRLIIMAGGTGGHVFPGLAVAHYLMEKGWKVHWIGTEDHIEANLVPKHGIKIDFIHIFGLRDKGIKSQINALRHIWKAVKQAKLIIRRFQPNVVLGMGGYVSGPGGLATWFCGIPLILHEQNSIAGFTNRYLAYIATTVLQGFPGAFPNAETVGNPLCRNILTLPIPIKRFQGREGPIRVLVIGGSQGAQILNHVAPEIAVKLGDKITLWHQVGKGALEIVLHNYERLGQMRHKVTEFIDHISIAYVWADIVICRSGALTVSEIAAVGLPAIFVPFQHQDRQQYWNARALEQIGAAKIIEQPHFNANIVCDILTHWHRPILLEMAKKARTLAMPNATERVAEILNTSLI